jgi:MFS family permease
MPRLAPFRLYLAAQCVSALGSQVALVAIPLTAVGLMHASPFQMGLLNAFERAPYLLIGLLVGVWVDGARRVRLMVGADFTRALLLVTVPLAALWLHLSIVHLMLVGFAIGSMTLIYETAAQALVPTLVPRDRLVAANGNIELVRSTAQLLGPALAGWFIGLLGAPLALFINVISFVVSGTTVLPLREELPERSPAARPPLKTLIAEGLVFVARDPVLRWIALTAASVNFFSSIAYAVYFLFLKNELSLGSGTIGTIVALTAAGGITGAAVGDRVERAIGRLRTMACAVLAVALSYACLPLMLVISVPRIPLLVVAAILGGLGAIVYTINAVATRQERTPDHLQGRVNVSFRLLVFGTMPLGALLGGWIGQTAGIHTALAVGGIATGAGALWLVPLARRRAALGGDTERN